MLSFSLSPNPRGQKRKKLLHQRRKCVRLSALPILRASSAEKKSSRVKKTKENGCKRMLSLKMNASSHSSDAAVQKFIESHCCPDRVHLSCSFLHRMQIGSPRVLPSFQVKRIGDRIYGRPTPSSQSVKTKRADKKEIIGALCQLQPIQRNGLSHPPNPYSFHIMYGCGMRSAKMLEGERAASSQSCCGEIDWINW